MHRAPSKRRQLIQRTIVYTAMTLLVVGLVTVLVLLMLGYRFNRETHTIEQGGLVQFISHPTGASVTVGNAHLLDTTPSKITVNPGSYLVKMERSGYRAWEKNVTVEAGKVLWLNYAQLVPEKIKTTDIRTYKTLTQARIAPKPAKEIKEAAIANALAQAKPTSHDKKHARAKRRWINVSTATAALLLIAGYFTYVNMPNISVRVAAAQAGINATYPEYQPAGYQLHGPVSYSEGQVSMQFAANSGPQAFTLNQTKSSWDSSALLAKYVDPKSAGNYATYSDAGLTIYTYGNHAAWVNGGILYTIDGSATLSNDQVRHIATSM